MRFIYLFAGVLLSCALLCNTASAHEGGDYGGKAAVAADHGDHHDGAKCGGHHDDCGCGRMRGPAPCCHWNEGCSHWSRDWRQGCGVDGGWDDWRNGWGEGWGPYYGGDCGCGCGHHKCGCC